MLKNLLPKGLLFVRRPFARIAASAILLLALAIGASAYTIVLRDGRRIEVTSDFTLTKSTLTYEIAPGITRTIQLILVDVAATERANNQAPGGFAKPAEQKLTTPLPPASPRAQRTLTNRELESVQQRRVESERAYEKRRVELGLPSIEESRRRQAQEEAETREWLRERSLAKSREESFWRERAGALRSEIVAVDGEINYLQARLSELGGQFPLATHSLITGVLPFGSLNTKSAVVPRVSHPGTFVAPRAGSAPMGRGQVLINPAPQVFRGPRGARPLAGFGIGSAFPFAAPIRPFDYVEDSYDRADLVGRLSTLLQTRAGLTARWRELEDEAREAQAPQIWLEP